MTTAFYRNKFAVKKLRLLSRAVQTLLPLKVKAHLSHRVTPAGLTAPLGPIANLNSIFDHELVTDDSSAGETNHKCNGMAGWKYM